MTVSVHVCLSVREHISGIARTISATHGRALEALCDYALYKSTFYFTYLLTYVARSSSGGIAIRYVHPVL